MSPAQASPPLTPAANRVSLAHVMLWIATTGAVLFCTERIWRFEFHLLPPGAPSVDSVIGYDGPASAEAEHRASMRKRILVNIKLACGALAFAPAYGAAFALAVISLVRLASRQRGHELQPGHWMSLAVSAVMLVVGPSLAFDWNNTLNYDVPGLMLFGLAAVMLLTGVLRVGRSRIWQLALAAAGAGSIGMGWVYFLELRRGGPLPPDLVEVLSSSPRIFLAAGIIGCVVAAALDIATKSQRGLQHWIGVLASFLAIGHWIIERITAGR